MSTSLDGFDANTIESVSFDAIPKGVYTVMATDSERKETKAKDGHYLNFTWEVIDGEFKGRKVFSLLNLWNANPQAVKIAKSDLKDICLSVGLPQPKDTAELHGKPLLIRVDVVSYNGNPKNEVKGYAPLNGAVGAAVAAPTAETKPANAAPWS